MSVYAYTALGKDGRKTTGTLAAESRAAAIAQMTRQGLSPVQIDEAKDAAAAAKKAQEAAAKAAMGGGKVPAKAVEGFTRELSNLLAGGVPLARSLALLRREASNPNAKQLWSDIHDDVVGGTALADALAKWPRSFSSVYVAMVRAGEAGGFLEVVLSQIADFRAREQDLKGKMKAAMVYPCVLAVLAVGVLIFMLTFFIPRFSGIFTQFGGDLPFLTKIIIAASNLVKGYGLFIAVGVVVLVIVARRALTTDSGRRKFEVAMLSIPVLGKVISHFALVRFSRMLGTLVGAGVPLIASLKVAREAIGNQTLADTVFLAIEEVQRGQSLSRALGDNAKLFPASVVETIAVAEE
ncbi:MAG TPA: type II secretion system F family protein, partial [Tepidisphaeraceae bacterium]|nr:type II secretion system F family protein [Tepidisphaeraceae bacterium]